jgi:hypothetical protein
MNTDNPELIDLTPHYSSNELPGRCLKCLAEEKLFSCMRELFNEERDTSKLERRYQLIYSLLESPDFENLRDETERYLADGKKVNVRIYLEDGKPKYELKIK